jgi:hypothetical protein
MKINNRARLGAWSFILLFPVASALRAQSYALIDVGALPGGNTVATKINLAGQVVGQSGKCTVCKRMLLPSPVASCQILEPCRGRIQ